MGRDWKQWAEKKGIQKWFRKDNLIILVLTGILLVIIALPTGSPKEEKGEEGNCNGIPSPAGTEGEAADGEAAGKAQEDYAASLEARLTEALSRMAYVGKVEVMITLKSSSELVVEKEQPVMRSSTNESDSQGGTRAVSQVDSRENTVYRTDGSSSEPYVVKTLPPRVEGVLVVAEGAGRGNVNKTIVEIAEALFGVEAHKVKVVKMEPETGQESQ